MDPTELALIENAREGDQHAFGELILRYQGLSFAVALGLTGNWTDSEDVVQEAFIRAWLHLRALTQPARFGSWLYTITRRAALECVARRRGERGVEVRDDDITRRPAETESPAEALGRHQVGEILWAEVARLPVRTREAVLLYYMEGLSTARGAEFLEISEGAFKMRLQYGRERLQESLARQLPVELHRRRPAEARRNAILAALAGLPPGGGTGGVAPGSGATGAGTGKMTGHLAWLTKPLAGVLAAVLVIGAVTGTILRTGPPAAPRSAAAPERRGQPAGQAAKRRDDPITNATPAKAGPAEARATAPRGFAIEGQALDWQTGQPIRGARPVLDPGTAGAQRGTPTTAREGWAFTNVAPGRHRLVLRKDDPALADYVFPAKDRDLALDLWIERGEAELRVYLPPSPWASGWVVDAQGRPVAGAEICSETGRDRPSCRSDGQGQFRFAAAHLTPDEAEALLIRANGFFTAAIRPIGVHDGHPAEGLRIRLTGLEQGGRVEGRVVNQRGEPVAGIPLLLRAVDPGGVNQTGIRYQLALETDASGRFSAAGVPPGPLRLQIDDGTGFLHEVDQLLSMAPGGKLEQVEIRLRQPAGTEALRGRLRHPDGQPAPGEIVFASDATSLTDGWLEPLVSARTAADGRFTLAGLPAGARVKLYLNDRNLPWAEGPVALGSGIRVSSSSLELTVPTPPPPHPATAPKPAAGGRPARLADAVIRTGSQQELVLLVRAGHPCLAVDAAGRMDDGSGVPLRTAPLITGQVTDELGRPVAGARIAIAERPQLGQAASDAGGLFSLLHPPGGGLMEVSRTGYRAKSIPKLTATAPRPGLIQHIVLTHDPKAMTGAIIGAVLDENGQPCPGVTVKGVLLARRTVNGNEHYAPTDGQGVFSFASVDPGDYELGLTTNRGYTEKVTVEPGQVSETLLRRGLGTLAGRVTRNGSPWAEPPILIQRDGLPEMLGQENGVPGGEGRFLFERLAPGRWTLNLIVGDPAFHYPVPVVLKAGERVEKEIELKPSIIEGRVCDPQGRAVPGCLVWLMTEQTREGKTYREALAPYLQPPGGWGSRRGEGMLFPEPDGRFRFSDVPQGTYTLLAASKSGSLTLQDVKPAGGRPVLGLKLELE